MKLTYHVKFRSFVQVGALSIGLSFVSPAFAVFPPWIVNSDGTGLIKLDTLGRADVFPSGINDIGQVTGTFGAFGGDGSRAFITGPNGAGMKMLGTLGGNSSWAVDINNTGQVVGVSSTANGEHHGFITGPNGVGMTDLGLTINPTALNDVGQVVGDLVPFGEYGPFRGFITGPNGVGITQLGSLAPGQSEWPRGINNLGQVVGRTESYNGVTHAFITGPNGVGMRDLGNLDLGGFYNAGEDINDTGQVVGYSSTASNEYHAFITGPDGVGMTDIGTLSGDWSWATAINDAGQVVGNFIPPGSTYEFTLAFISDSSGGTVDLNSLVHLPGGALLTQAIDINNRGQILVTSGIPEPATYALMLAGLGLVGFMARRTKSNRWSDEQARYRSRSKSVSASPRAFVRVR